MSDFKFLMMEQKINLKKDKINSCIDSAIITSMMLFCKLLTHSSDQDCFSMTEEVTKLVNPMGGAIS